MQKNELRKFTRVVWWRYWKRLQRSFCSVGHLSYAGSYFLNLNAKIMSTNKLSKETELRLADFFNNSIDPKLMAKTLRKVNYLLALSVMRESEILEAEKISLENGFYWLNELAEILNPYLDSEC